MTPPLLDLPWLQRAPEDYLARLKSMDAASDGKGAILAALTQSFLSQVRLDKLGARIKLLQDSGANLEPLQKVTLGLISNATTEYTENALRATATRYGFDLHIVVADFDQAMQEALNPAGVVNAARPDLVLLMLDHRGLPFDPAPGLADGEASVLSHLRRLRDGCSAHSGGRVILQTIARPADVLFGNLDRRTAGTWTKLVHDVNAGIETLARETGDLVLDVAGLAETVGLSAWHDPARWYAAKIPFALDALPLYADHVCRLIAAWKGRSRKCLVFDLDNTLWGGVIGDDGLDGIVIGNGDGAGESFLALQKVAKALSQRGIVLAVCSKNDENNALEPFRKHPEMILKENDFAAFVANWTDKASNLRAIAKSLDLGLDSFVFVDDNPVERAQVRSELPQVAVPELPDDPSGYAGTLLQAGYFEAIAFTDEDRVRAAQYQANLQRTSLMVEGQSIDDFLHSLEMTLDARPFDAVGRARITQLINKTNQFNLTTLRCDEADVRRYEEDQRFFTAQVRVVDRFSDNGMIGVVVAERKGTNWELPIWLMSCRVLNRKVEEGVLNHVAAAAADSGARSLIGYYKPTAKNGMVRDFYRRMGFDQVSEDETGASVWRLALDGFVPFATPFQSVAAKRYEDA